MKTINTWGCNRTYSINHENLFCFKSLFKDKQDNKIDFSFINKTVDLNFYCISAILFELVLKKKILEEIKAVIGIIRIIPTPQLKP
ncbi:hypothetical protein CLOBL_15850 [Clostridium sp. BL-8]|nr:hypothetical protein CLOBL_15850 [Clostridium sp. BL-8]